MQLRRISFWAAVSACTAFTWAAAGSEAPFDYFQNNWTVIGLKDYARGTRVTPDNELLLAKDRKIRFRIGKDKIRLTRSHLKENLQGWLPMIVLAAEDGPVRYQFCMWATPLPEIADWKAAFNWPAQGEDYLNWVRVQITNTGQEPATTAVVTELVEGKKVGSHVDRLELPAGSHRTVTLRIPFEKPFDWNAYADQDAELWFKRTIDFWHDTMLRKTQISVPCRKSSEALLAAHVCQLIANDHGELRGGEGFYDEFYLRDGAYQVMELEEAGLLDVSRVVMGKYLQRQRPDGRFETQKNQWDANGQSLWTLWQFYKISGDTTWMSETAYPAMRRSADWIAKARREAPADSPFAGLLPIGPADGEYLWDAKHHIVGYDFWNLRGLLCTADAAKSLGRIEEAAELSKEADSYRQAIDAAWKRTGLSHFPPSWEKDGTHWGNTETLWPTELFAIDDPRVAALSEEVRKRHGGGFCEGVIRWTGLPDVIHPYMSAYTTMTDLARGEHEQVVEDYYWYLLHSTATHAFPEGIYFKQRMAWNDTIPHVTGACNFAILLRHMLVHERADELHLLSAVPDWWLADGREIAVKHAPTHFGWMSMTVRGKPKGVEIDFQRPTERPAERILLHLPKSRPLLKPIDGVQVVTRGDQSTRWDFPKVVGLYAKTAPPLSQPAAE